MLDIMLSVSGSNLLQTFRESLLNRNATQLTTAAEQTSTPNETDDYDEDDDDYDSILERLPADTSILQECVVASQGCVLLLYIKQTLKEMYGFTDNKIQQYSPNETVKVSERPLNRKGHVRFNPETVIEFIKSQNLVLGAELDEKGKQQLVQEYIHFKQLMLTIDPSDEDDEDNQTTKPVVSSVAAVTANPAERTTTTATSENRDTEAKPTQSSPEKPAKSSVLKKSKSPSHSRHHKKSHKAAKEKVKKKHKKKRKRLIDSASEDSNEDPDYMDSS